eukprot:gene22472-29592_t
MTEHMRSCGRWLLEDSILKAWAYTATQRTKMVESLLRRFEPAAKAWTTAKGGLRYSPAEVASHIGLVIRTGRPSRSLSNISRFGMPQESMDISPIAHPCGSPSDAPPLWISVRRPPLSISVRRPPPVDLRPTPPPVDLCPTPPPVDLRPTPPPVDLCPTPPPCRSLSDAPPCGSTSDAPPCASPSDAKVLCTADEQQEAPHALHAVGGRDALPAPPSVLQQEPPHEESIISEPRNLHEMTPSTKPLLSSSSDASCSPAPSQLFFTSLSSNSVAPLPLNPCEMETPPAQEPRTPEIQDPGTPGSGNSAQDTRTPEIQDPGTPAPGDSAQGSRTPEIQDPGTSGPGDSAPDPSNSLPRDTTLITGEVPGSPANLMSTADEFKVTVVILAAQSTAAATFITNELRTFRGFGSMEKDAMYKMYCNNSSARSTRWFVPIFVGILIMAAVASIRQGSWMDLLLHSGTGAVYLLGPYRATGRDVSNMSLWWLAAYSYRAMGHLAYAYGWIFVTSLSELMVKGPWCLILSEFIISPHMQGNLMPALAARLVMITANLIMFHAANGLSNTLMLLYPLGSALIVLVIDYWRQKTFLSSLAAKKA